MRPAILFVGPTLCGVERDLPAGLVLRPPAARGDVASAVIAGARVIGLIDGYFETVPAVMHKELLYALAEGVHVLGAASMGALRAAELHGHGMIGVGRVFEAFRDGLLVDDDEVAIAHGPAELGFVPASEAMVDIRATIDAACACGVLDGAGAALLTGLAKAIFYKDRRWPAIFAAAAATEGSRPDELERFAHWLPAHRVEQKRTDALALLDAVAAILRDQPALPHLAWRFERTDAFASLLDEPARSADGERSELEAAVLDELVLRPDLMAILMPRALARAAALGGAGTSAAGADRRARGEAMTAFRLERGLATSAALNAWCLANDVDGPALEALVAETARAQQYQIARLPELGPALLAELRLSGNYPALAARAKAKALALAASGEPLPPEPLALDWFRTTRLSGLPPSRKSELMAALGLRSSAELHRLLGNELLYSSRCRGTDPSMDTSKA